MLQANGVPGDLVTVDSVRLFYAVFEHPEWAVQKAYPHLARVRISYDVEAAILAGVRPESKRP
jgi:hypothetical protein